MKLLKLNLQYDVPKKYVVLIILWLLPTNRTILSEKTNSTGGPTMQLKGNTELVSPLK